MGTERVIGVCLDLSSAYTRELIQGIRRFARMGHPCRLAIVHPDKVDLGAWARSGLDGVILTLAPAAQAARLLPSSLPRVFTMDLEPPSGCPRVIADSRAIGRAVAAHFLGRGFWHFGYTGFPWFHFSNQRQAGFVEALTQAGRQCSVYKPDNSLDAWAPEEDSGALVEWLRGLPKPVAIMACNDNRARHVTVACGMAGVRVGSEVALIGVDNDSVTCELAEVPLSSIDPRAALIGHEAAELLHAMMEGAPWPSSDLVVAPGDLVQRESSDMFAVGDPTLVLAAQFIHEHACDPIQVGDVVKRVLSGRRTLEQKFRAAFGRTLHEEIRWVQLDRARRLLADTQMTVRQVALKCGFVDLKQFGHLFHEAVGTSPAVYRKQTRSVRQA